MKRASALVLAGAFLATGAALGVVAVRGPAPARSIDDRVHRISVTLRCPVCQDLSVADSPSLVAKQIRATIAQRLRAGQTPDQITAYFVSHFGQSVLLTPQGNGIDLLAWIVPALLVAGGLGTLALAVTRWSGSRARKLDPAALSDGDRAMLERELRTFHPEAT